MPRGGACSWSDCQHRSDFDANRVYAPHTPRKTGGWRRVAGSCSDLSLGERPDGAAAAAAAVDGDEAQFARVTGALVFEPALIGFGSISLKRTVAWGRRRPRERACGGGSGSGRDSGSRRTPVSPRCQGDRRLVAGARARARGVRKLGPRPWLVANVGCSQAKPSLRTRQAVAGSAG